MSDDVTEIPFTVTNRHGEHGATFLVRLVMEGDGFGREDVLVHDSADPMIEFYDRAHADKPGFGPRGQFVSRYYLSTILGEPVRGINLHGSEPKWYVTAENIAEVLRYVLVELTKRFGLTR